MLYPHFDPAAFSAFGFSLKWYGLMYVFAFFTAWALARLRARQSCGSWTAEQIDDLITVGMIGVVVGGRVGYMLFYDFAGLRADPLEIFRIWNGGMSFHGGLCGVMTALWWWGKHHGRAFLDIMDFAAPLVPPGLFFGRIGNFINSELWGAPTTVPWGMALQPGGVLRHPSQLYEAFFEGLVLFVMLWWYSSKPRPVGRVAGLFAFGYGVARFGVEFVRSPDAHIGYLAFGWLTMGQVLSLPLVALGLWLLLRNPAQPVSAPPHFKTSGKENPAHPCKRR